MRRLSPMACGIEALAGTAGGQAAGEAVGVGVMDWIGLVASVVSAIVGVGTFAFVDRGFADASQRGIVRVCAAMLGIAAALNVMLVFAAVAGPPT